MQDMNVLQSYRCDNFLLLLLWHICITYIWGVIDVRLLFPHVTDMIGSWQDRTWQSYTCTSLLCCEFFLNMWWQVKKVNGVEVDNLKHLCRLLENCSEESVRFDLDDDRVIVLNRRLAKVATSKILKCHRIPSVMSDDLTIS